MHMRRIAIILLFVFVVIPVILLILYAAPPTRPWMETTLGPPLSQIGGGILVTIADSAPVQFLLANPALIAVISLILGIVPVSFPLLHTAFNRHRGFWVRSAQKEVGPAYVQMDQPVAQAQTYQVNPQPVSAQPAPTPAPAPVPEQKPAETA